MRIYRQATSSHIHSRYTYREIVNLAFSSAFYLSYTCRYLVCYPGGVHAYESLKDAEGGGEPSGRTIPEGQLFGVSAVKDVGGIRYLRAYAGWVRTAGDETMVMPVRREDVVVYGRAGTCGFINGVYEATGQQVMMRVGGRDIDTPVFSRRGGEIVGGVRTGPLFLYFSNEHSGWAISPQVHEGRPFAVTTAVVEHPSSTTAVWRVRNSGGTFEDDPAVNCLVSKPMPETVEELAVINDRSRHADEIRATIPLAVAPPSEGWNPDLIKAESRTYVASSYMPDASNMAATPYANGCRSPFGPLLCTYV